MTTPRLKADAGRIEAAEPIFYPIEDDEPLAESEYQLFPLTYAHRALKVWFADDPTTWVGADMFLYYEEGNPAKVVAPDVFVVTQTHKRELRNIFQTWVEGRIPDFILEVLSEKNYRNDLVTKFPLYREMGVLEYWMYDPTPTGILSPPLQGNQLVRGHTSRFRWRRRSCPDATAPPARRCVWSCTPVGTGSGSLTRWPANICRIMRNRWKRWLLNGRRWLLNGGRWLPNERPARSWNACCSSTA